MKKKFNNKNPKFPSSASFTSLENGNFSMSLCCVNFRGKTIFIKGHLTCNVAFVLTCYGLYKKSTDLLRLIVIDSDRGEPVTTEEVKYGIRVAVIAMAADSQLTTERAIKVVGPRAFGYDFDYTPFTN